MIPPDSIWTTLGVAAPLVAILYYLLRQSTEERKETTMRFLDALTTTVAQSTEAMHAVQESVRLQQAAAVAANTAAVTSVMLAADVATKQAASSTSEHLRMTAALQAIAESIASQSGGKTSTP